MKKTNCFCLVLAMLVLSNMTCIVSADILTPEIIKVQAESPDTYLDSTPGKASSWMLDGYGDMDVSQEAGGGAIVVSFGYTTSISSPTEWLRYKVTVPESATYKMSMNVGNTKDCSVDVWVNNTGAEVFEAYRKLVSATGAYTTRKDAFIGYLNLKAGDNYIKIVNDNSPIGKYEAMSFDYFTLSKVIYTGNEGEIIVDGADYNAGGEGVGYHDTTAGASSTYKNGDDLEMILENTGERVIVFYKDEWLKYDVVVQKPTRYKLYVLAGTANTATTIGVALNEGATTAYAFPSTGGTALANRQNFTYICDLDLIAGRNTIKLTKTASTSDFYYKGFKLVTNDPYSISRIGFDTSDLAAGSIISSVNAAKMNAYGSDANLYVAVYNELDELCYVTMQTVPALTLWTTAIGDFAPTAITLDSPITLEASKGSSFTAKAFIWSADESIEPLSKSLSE